MARYPMVPQGVSADLIATMEGFTRQDVDGFATRSQERAAAAIEDGRFERSVVPIRDEHGAIVLDRDEFPRPGTTIETLAKLEPSFAKLGSAALTEYGYERSFDEMCLGVYPEIAAVEHVHHAGNSSGVVDGAAAIRGGIP